MELADEHARVIKITIPPFFGFTPFLKLLPVVNLRGDYIEKPPSRISLEFHGATPLEYIDRWIAANEVFGDDADIASVISWAGGQVSFVVTQPQYHGEPASLREIDGFFTSSGWYRLPDISGHTLFYNYAFQVLAIDALSRNCYTHKGLFLPFDVILCHPDESIEKFLRLYPE